MHTHVKTRCIKNTNTKSLIILCLYIVHDCILYVIFLFLYCISILCTTILYTLHFCTHRACVHTLFYIMHVPILCLLVHCGFLYCTCFYIEFCNLYEKGVSEFTHYLKKAESYILSAKPPREIMLQLHPNAPSSLQLKWTPMGVIINERVLSNRTSPPQ